MSSYSLELSHRIAKGEELISEHKKVSRHQIAKIIPVLVHVDPAIRTPPAYLAARFKEALGRIKRPTVTPLVVLPFTELEEIGSPR